jgi:hypothetical protein|tara:strand:- start:22589 stop:22813 length:225 start_codon:yes stop_codon:yes gene_type:complete
MMTQITAEKEETALGDTLTVYHCPITEIVYVRQNTEIGMTSIPMTKYWQRATDDERYEAKRAVEKKYPSLEMWW